MSKKVIFIILIASVAINLATLVTFSYFWCIRDDQKGPYIFHQPNHIKNWGKNPMIKKLELTQEQLNEIRRMREEMGKGADSLRIELFKRRKELMDILKQDDVDQSGVDSIINEISNLQAQHEKRIMKNFQHIRDILTQEQREKLGEFLHMALEEHRPPPLPDNGGHLFHPDPPHPPHQPPSPPHGR